MSRLEAYPVTLGRRQVSLPEHVQTLEAAVLTCGAFLVPLLLQQPQLLVGTVVNMALVLGALHLGTWRRIAPLVILPAVAAVLGGMLFDSRVTLGLVCLIPGIWAGNAVFVAWLKTWREAPQRRSYLPTLLGAAVVKMLVIGVAAWVLALLGLLPWALVSVLVPLQVVTALLGGLLAVPVSVAIRRFAGG